MTDMRTPLSRVRGLGSAKQGTDHFWLQRVTALITFPLVLFFLVSVLGHIGADYHRVLAYLGNPFVAVLMMLFVLFSVWHMRLGMQTVIEDYIHHRSLKVIAVILNVLFTSTIAIAFMLMIVKLVFF